MEVFLPRSEIRRRALALTGNATDATMSAPDLARMNASIDMAAATVAEQSRWLSLRRRATIRIGSGGVSWGSLEQARWLEQQYPSLYNPAVYGTGADTWVPTDLNSATINNLGPGGIIEAAWWDANGPFYRPLPIADTPAMYDVNRQAQYPREVEKTSIAAGDTSAETADKVAAAVSDMQSQTGEPISIRKTGSGLELWPTPDTPRVCRIVYDVSPEWETPGTTLTASTLDAMYSVVDGLAIVYLVAAERFALEGDDYMEGRYTSRVSQRISELRARAQTGEAIEVDPTITYRDFTDYQRTPNWQRAR
jgi:hypothetical protein